jgi:hypothetical protein
VEVLLNILVELGFLVSITLLLLGMVLCAMLRFGDGSHRRRARPRDREFGVQPVSGSPDHAHLHPDDAPEFDLSRPENHVLARPRGSLRDHLSTER